MSSSRLSFFRSFFLALVAASLLTATCNAAPAPEVADEPTVALTGINAQRLAAGLGPATPKNLVAPRKIEKRHRPSASEPLPCEDGNRSAYKLKRSAGQSHSGIICVHYPGNDTLVGYVSRSFTSDGYYTISRDPDMALELSFKSDHWRHFDFRISTPQDDELPFLGAITSSTSSHNVTASSLGSHRARLGFTSRTPIMAPPAPMPQPLSSSSEQTPMADSTTFRAYESAIWNFDFSTAQLKPTWVNPDGKAVEDATTVHERGQGTVAITADGADVEGDDEAVAVNFYFEPSA
ncbi:hypothetical protein M407DRAFT_159160 [Tulasnella calospora MUT 4182]|uniref:Uncharacterized protein n=1 Tax=Tulasnella calospora MUT 4182 TaxID=1051891 RepID=A0A0C3Q4X8_9AGAM|nr:hypothetical protein M407DRAFT_159160 [Tulasnella calospora MUT 4182]